MRKYVRLEVLSDYSPKRKADGPGEHNGLQNESMSMLKQSETDLP